MSRFRTVICQVAASFVSFAGTSWRCGVISMSFFGRLAARPFGVTCKFVCHSFLLYLKLPQEKARAEMEIKKESESVNVNWRGT